MERAGPKKRKPSKLMRMVKAMEPCAAEYAKAQRRYCGMTLAQAWEKADCRDLQYVLQRAGIDAPVRCRYRNPNCWFVTPKDADAIRAKFPKGIPAELKALYEKA